MLKVNGVRVDRLNLRQDKDTYSYIFKSPVFMPMGIVFVFLFVCSFVCSFVLPSVTLMEFTTKVASKFLKWYM